MKSTNFYEGYSDAPQKLRFLTNLFKNVLFYDHILLFVPDARQLLMQKPYDSPTSIFQWKYNIFGKMCPVPLGIQNAKKTQKTTNFAQKRVLNTFWLLPALGKTPKCHIWTQRAVPLGRFNGFGAKVTQTAPFLPIGTGSPGQKNPAAEKRGTIFAPLGANWLGTFG